MQQLTPEISISTSRLWETNTGIIHGPEGAILVDPGVFPSEIESIAQSVGPVIAGFCTHAHWDHMLWHECLGQETPRYATPETIALMQRDRERIMSSLSTMEAEAHSSGGWGNSERWDHALLFKEQPIDWGPGSLAGVTVEIIHIPGHEDGQAALLLPNHGVAFVADTLSDRETPSVNDGSRSIALYLSTLDRLQGIVDQVDWIVPGHGSPTNKAGAQLRLDADRRYLAALEPIVNSAPEGEGTEDLARRILHDLDEKRAQSELAWSMHLDNVQQLVHERQFRETGYTERRSSRLILLDDDHRVWMLRIADPVRPRWMLPGGGVDEGESWEDAARREMWEECAIDDAEIGSMVAVRDRVAVIDMVSTPKGMVNVEPRAIRALERYFLVYLGQQQPGIDNMLDYEMADYTRQAWLSADDIRKINEVVYPLGLADLLDTVANGDIPSEPWIWRD